MQTEDQNEKRVLIRLHVNVKVYNEDTGEPLGYTANMHIEGMMLKSYNAIGADTEYRIRLEFVRLDDTIVDITMTARCLWCKPSEHPDFHSSGFSFTNVSAEQKSRIESLIRMLAVQS